MARRFFTAVSSLFEYGNVIFQHETEVFRHAVLYVAAAGQVDKIFSRHLAGEEHFQILLVYPPSQVVIPPEIPAEGAVEAVVQKIRHIVIVRRETPRLHSAVAQYHHVAPLLTELKQALEQDHRVVVLREEKSQYYIVRYRAQELHFIVDVAVPVQLPVAVQPHERETEGEPQGKYCIRAQVAVRQDAVEVIFSPELVVRGRVGGIGGLRAGFLVVYP